MPMDNAFSAAFLDATMAVNGFPLFMSLSETMPPETVAMVSLPVTSVICIIVLFSDENMCATPHRSLSILFTLFLRYLLHYFYLRAKGNASFFLLLDYVTWPPDSSSVH